MKLQETLIQKEKELLLPEVRHSVSKLKKLLSDIFIEIGSSRNQFGLKEVLVSLPKEQGWTATISDIEFRMIHEDIAQIFYVATITQANQGEYKKSRRTSVWKKESGEWKMIFHQGTVIS